MTEGDPPALQVHLQRIGAWLGAECAVACGIVPGLQGPTLTYLYGLERACEDGARLLAELLREHPHDWGLWDPARPDPRQRNAALTKIDLAGLDDLSRVPAFRDFLPAVGLAGLDELRVLVCSGATPLACVAAFREGAFGEVERARLQRLVPALRCRLELESLLSGAPLVLAVVDALLDGLGTPAFVLGPHGEVAHANHAGRALMDRDQDRVREELRNSLLGRVDLFRTVRLSVRGVPSHQMAVLRGGAFDLGARLASVSSRWALTPKQTEVLALLARGECNKSIASDLACAEATVELHVSAILSKARCERRAELVAHFWSDA